MGRYRRVLALLGLATASVAVACGGAPSGGAASPADSSDRGGSAGARCLASAEAKHSRKPSEPSKITAKHILVRYEGAKGAPTAVTRSREDACLRAEEALAKLKGGLSFSDAVTQYSDATGVRHDGSIGTVERSDVAGSFADAAFELETGEVSQVVETPFGFHVILRVE
jgi:NIMA-interacting peptidyl-prolyl cis-trans isomerase 1